MALGTYSDLKTAIGTWLARSGDGVITGSAADYVTLAESRLNRMLPLQINRVDLVMSCAAASRNPQTFPTDFYEPIALFLTTFGIETMLQPGIVGNFEYGTTQAAPQGWAINSNGTSLQIDLDRPCDQTHTFKFRYRKSFALSDAAPTNWLLTNHPDAYLAACLVEAATMTGDDAAELWQGRLNMAIEEITYKDARLMALAPLTVDPALVTAPGFNIYTG